MNKNDVKVGKRYFFHCKIGGKDQKVSGICDKVDGDYVILVDSLGQQWMIRYDSLETKGRNS